MISRSNISKELTPNLGNAKRRKNMPGMSRVGLSPAEEKRSGTYSEADRRKNMKKGGKVGKKEQGYKAREDESIAMRKKKKRTKNQLAASRDDSYGKFGSKAKKRGRINLSSGGIALRGHGSEIR
tara:strand:- start:400 stop:774 length:375 start_codon:yes stop_codon:yes gene_type:complete